MGEFCHFDRQRKTAQPLDQLGAVGNHDHALRRACHDLFPQQRTAAAFDKRKLAVRFIGPVDDEIKRRKLLKRRNGDAEAFRHHCGSFGARGACDVQASANARREHFQECLRGGARAEPQLHAILHLLERLGRSRALEHRSVRIAHGEATETPSARAPAAILSSNVTRSHCVRNVIAMCNASGVRRPRSSRLNMASAALISRPSVSMTRGTELCASVQSPANYPLLPVW